MTTRMTKKLSDFAVIHAGHPFRGTITPVPGAKTPVVQVRDVDGFGEINTHELVRTELTGRKQPDWLQRGDILFVAKGAKHFATCVNELPEPSVCSPHFFIVRIKGDYSESVLPEFISWQLNQIPAQHYYKSTAEGSLYVSIRRKILEDTPITLPTITKQQQLVALYRAAVNEHKVLLQLIENRQHQMNAIARDIL